MFCIALVGAITFSMQKPKLVYFLLPLSSGMQIIYILTHFSLQCLSTIAVSQEPCSPC